MSQCSSNMVTNDVRFGLFFSCMAHSLALKIPESRKVQHMPLLIKGFDSRETFGKRNSIWSPWMVIGYRILRSMSNLNCIQYDTMRKNGRLQLIGRGGILHFITYSSWLLCLPCNICPPWHSWDGKLSSPTNVSFPWVTQISFSFPGSTHGSNRPCHSLAPVMRIFDKSTYILWIFLAGRPEW